MKLTVRNVGITTSGTTETEGAILVTAPSSLIALLFAFDFDTTTDGFRTQIAVTFNSEVLALSAFPSGELNNMIAMVRAVHHITTSGATIQSISKYIPLPGIPVEAGASIRVKGRCSTTGTLQGYLYAYLVS